MAHTMQIFFSVLVIMILLAVFIPIFNSTIGQASTDYIDGLENKVLNASYKTIAINILTIPVWTFGLDIWINTIVLLPLRIIGLVSLWYIISPAK